VWLKDEVDHTTLLKSHR